MEPRDAARALLCAVVLALALVGTASAANDPSPALDAAASAVAGKPVTVWCETDWSAWSNLTSQAGYTPDGAEAFTYFDTPVVYASPGVCATLHLIRKALPFTAADALLALAHEATHQSGVVDEGETDCAALRQVAATAVRLGVPARVTTYTTKLVRRRVHGRWRKVRVKVRHTAVNPLLGTLMRDAEYWHRLKPPAYQGGC